MDQFIVVASFTDHSHADAICGALEAMKIPVIMEHVEISEHRDYATVVRIMVPAEFVQRATNLMRCLSVRPHHQMPQAVNS